MAVSPSHLWALGHTIQLSPSGICELIEAHQVRGLHRRLLPFDDLQQVMLDDGSALFAAQGGLDRVITRPSRFLTENDVPNLFERWQIELE